MDLRRKHNRMSGLITLGAIGVAVLVLGTTAFLAARSPADAPADKPEETSEQVEIYKGPMPGFSATDIRYGEDVLGYRLNPAPYFAAGRGNVFIENPIENDYDLQVDYELPNGEILYQSPTLSPGEYVADGYLEEALGDGIYDMLARLYAVDPDAGVIVGVVEIEIQATVEN